VVSVGGSVFVGDPDFEKLDDHVAVVGIAPASGDKFIAFLHPRYSDNRKAVYLGEVTLDLDTSCWSNDNGQVCAKIEGTQ
jgi:hypothetical protein